MKLAAVVAAAGLSSRMHEFKPLMTLGDSTVIGSVVNNLLNTGVQDIIVVTGYKTEILKPYLDKLGIRSCYNKKYASSEMFDSICLGLKECNNADRVFITPGDVPLVSETTIKKMLECKDTVVCPRYAGKNGHPILLDRQIIPSVLNYSGKDGLRGAICNCGCEITYIEVDDIGIALDADTPEDFAVLRKHEMIMKGRSGLWTDIKITLGIDDEIFTPENAQFLEMIDHLGSIRLACSSMHMSYSKGWKLLNKMETELGFKLVNRQNGGLGGGGTSVTMQGKKYLSAYQSFRNDVRKYAEISFKKHFPGE